MSPGPDYLFDLILGILALFFAVYLAVIFLLAIIWRFRERSELASISQSTSVSVVVAYRNEISNLPGFIAALSAQTDFDGNIELIAVNDHSDDGGDAWMASQVFARGRMILIDAQGSGKKAAIREGIEVASGELIVSCDADCVPGPEWIKTIVTKYRQDDADMLAGPVRMLPGDTLIGQYDAIDYYSLQVSSAAHQGRLSGLLQCCKYGLQKVSLGRAQDLMDGQNYLSGDDVFLLHAFKNLANA